MNKQAAKPVQEMADETLLTSMAAQKGESRDVLQHVLQHGGGIDVEPAFPTEQATHEISKQLGAQDKMVPPSKVALSATNVDSQEVDGESTEQRRRLSESAETPATGGSELPTRISGTNQAHLLSYVQKLCSVRRHSEVEESVQKQVTT